MTHNNNKRRETLTQTAVDKNSDVQETQGYKVAGNALYLTTQQYKAHKMARCNASRHTAEAINEQLIRTVIFEAQR